MSELRTETGDAAPDDDRIALARSLDEDLRRLLVPLLIVLALIMAQSAVRHLLRAEETGQALTGWFDVGTVIGLLAGAALLHWRPPGPFGAHPIAFTTLMLLTIGSTLHLGLLGSPLASLDLILLALATGLFFLHPGWFAAALMLVVASWAYGVALSQVQAAWEVFGLALIEAALFATLLFMVRRRTAIRLHRLHLDEARARRDLERAHHQLEGFTRSVSHDLQQPLTNLGLDLRLLDRRIDAEEERSILGRARRASDRLGDVVHDLLALATARDQSLEPSWADVDPILRDITESLDATDPTRAVTWVLPGPVQVRADEGLLHILFQNLLQNAWKYTSDEEAARIEVTIEPTPDGEGTRVAVSDNGIGLSPEDATRMFEPFQRGAGASSWKGSGIGLATVRTIVDRHGGTLGAEGEPGEGARIWFTLPGATRPATDGA